MEFPDLTDEQDRLMGYFDRRRTDLNGGLTAAQIAEVRDWPQDKAESIIRQLVDMGMLEAAKPGLQTDLSADANPICYGPSERGLAWLKREHDADIKATVTDLMRLTPRGR